MQVKTILGKIYSKPGFEHFKIPPRYHSIFHQKLKKKKKGLAIILTLLGIGGLVFGVITIFNVGLTNSNPWIGVILGAVFFTAGIGLLKTTSDGQGA